MNFTLKQAGRLQVPASSGVLHIGQRLLLSGNSGDHP